MDGSISPLAVLLGGIKSILETGDPYAHMYASRSYQAPVHHLEDQNRASDGVPCILLVVCGHKSAPRKISQVHRVLDI